MFWCGTVNFRSGAARWKNTHAMLIHLIDNGDDHPQLVLHWPSSSRSRWRRSTAAPGRRLLGTASRLAELLYNINSSSGGRRKHPNAAENDVDDGRSKSFDLNRLLSRPRHSPFGQQMDAEQNNSGLLMLKSLRIGGRRR